MGIAARSSTHSPAHHSKSHSCPCRPSHILKGQVLNAKVSEMFLTRSALLGSSESQVMNRLRYIVCVMYKSSQIPTTVESYSHFLLWSNFMFLICNEGKVVCALLHVETCLSFANHFKGLGSITMGCWEKENCHYSTWRCVCCHVICVQSSSMEAGVLLFPPLHLVPNPH
jgi:hypothetical protein